MARSLSVKIPTASLIADVEASIADLEAKIATYPLDMETFRVLTKAHEEMVLRTVVEALKNPDNIGEDYNSIIRVQQNRYGRNNVEITVNTDLLGIPQLPECPTNPNVKESFGRDYTTRLDLLKKNLKVLKMTNQEEVNASTYNTVIDLL